LDIGSMFFEKPKNKKNLLEGSFLKNTFKDD
jgi:hypothetical protein